MRTEERTDSRTDGQTDMSKVVVAFRNFANAPKKVRKRTLRCRELFSKFGVYMARLHIRLQVVTIEV